MLDFGDLTRSGNQITACSNSTRGLFAGGNPETDTIDYVTIAATGNAVDFGNLTATIQNPTALANPVRALFAGGEDNPASPVTNRIDYVSILSTGNAQDFGDLTQARRTAAACSNSTEALLLVVKMDSRYYPCYHRFCNDCKHRKCS